MTTPAKSIGFGYSVLCYLASVASLVCFIVFVSDLCPHYTVNRQQTGGSAASALLINLGLLLLFGLQHSVMARQGFKNWIKRYIGDSVQRASYCLGTALVIGVLTFYWQPMAGLVWQVENTTLVAGIRTVAALGWGVLLLATFQIDHFELFGLRQAFTALRGGDGPRPAFKMAGLYRLVRHPIQTGVLIGIWAVPASTSGHLLFALGMTVYIFIGLYFEEQDLVREFGDTYRDYKQRVAKVIPFIG